MTLPPSPVLDVLVGDVGEAGEGRQKRCTSCHSNEFQGRINSEEASGTWIRWNQGAKALMASKSLCQFSEVFCSDRLFLTFGAYIAVVWYLPSLLPLLGALLGSQAL